MDVSGKKALVFGGTSGIGLATAKKLKDKGAEVVVISRDPSKAGDLDGIKTLSCDVRDTDALSALFASEAPFDILISAATGGSRAAGPFLKMDIEGYRNSFDKLWGYTNCVRFGTEYLSDNGSIVLVSGSPARRAPATASSTRSRRTRTRTAAASSGTRRTRAAPRRPTRRSAPSTRRSRSSGATA